ncbi:response regulator transcription factor [Leucobacter weissii]|uniref:DNA-binding response regulator MtrA n=1 Tax=Leucobacter weissii TaxID=1983706 RepID=A0A939ML36_9MICO|nr:MtrAB system response regulator MtrA [Leucobacter weissii]MBO1900622.1 response regulator transcription factor [Leucobacter weissii]
MSARILVVDDDRALAEMLGMVLQSEGFLAEHSADGLEAVEKFREIRPDLVLLDLMLPGLDGIEVCARIRSESGTPIIMLTARTDTVDVVRGLEAGADDYVMKPFNPAELIARVRARLREPQQEAGETLRVGDLEIDVSAHEVRRDDQAISLTPLEFELLVILARKPQQVFTREVLLEKVWGYQYKADTRLVNVHVQRLRAKIERDPDHPAIVTTVRGVGYRAGSTSASEAE